MKRAFFFYIFCYSISFAQFEKESDRKDPSSINPIFLETIPYLTDDSTAIDLKVLYRFNSEFLFFIRSNKAQQEYFEANGELIVEITDSNNVTVGREYRQMRVIRNSMPGENSLPPDEIQGIFSFSLKRGSYKVIAEAKDNGSGKSFINRDISIDSKNFLKSELYISPVLFIDQIKTDSSFNGQNIFFPFYHGNNLILDRSGACLFQLFSPDTSTKINLKWKIQRKRSSKNFPAISGDQYFQKSGTLALIEDPKKASILIKKGSDKSRFIFIPMPLKKLDEGVYSINIQVTQGGLKSEKDFSFNIIWPHKPFSLSNAHIALDALKLIASKEEIKQFSAASDDEFENELRTFWQKHSPDTTQAYNPVMAEFYRRVDEAIKRFSTTVERDGYNTDRGHIYILFGAPNIVNRLLKPNTVPTEIWTYEKLKKRYIFKDQKKNGNFILVETENI